MSGYWKYYDENFDWKTETSIHNPDFEFTIEKLQREGLTKDDSIRLFNSGYVCFEGFEILIDRFYGGPLSSYDMRTRFPLSEAMNLLTQSAKSLAKVHKVKSIEEVKALIDTAKVCGSNLIFRGQNRNHFLEREIPNPYLSIQGYGEVSLLPSLWRKMYNINPQSFTEFTTLSLLEWSNIFYSAFDIPEINKRHEALLKSGEFIFTMADMEDCSDEILREFGKFRLDLAMGMNHNLSTTLTTLLQHYGLYSPVLDLTESLNVALFFATHKYEKTEFLSNYKFVGSNNKQSVIYLLRFDKNEMERHNERNEFLKYLEPLRPIKQKCVVCRTNQYSINLPAFYLDKVIILDFDINENISGLSYKDIFPDENSDKFLNAIYNKSIKKEAVTIF